MNVFLSWRWTDGVWRASPVAKVYKRFRECYYPRRSARTRLWHVWKICSELPGNNCVTKTSLFKSGERWGPIRKGRKRGERRKGRRNILCKNSSSTSHYHQSIPEPLGSLGHHRWYRNQFPPFFPVLHWTLGLGERQACPFPHAVFPPLPLSALPCSPFIYKSCNWLHAVKNSVFFQTPDCSDVVSHSKLRAPGRRCV